MWFKFRFWWAVFQPFTHLLLYRIFVFSCVIRFSQNIYSVSFYFSLQCCIWNHGCFIFSSFLQNYKDFICILYFPNSLLINCSHQAPFKRNYCFISFVTSFCLWTIMSSVTLSFHIFLQGRVSVWYLIAISFFVSFFCCKWIPAAHIKTNPHDFTH